MELQASHPLKVLLQYQLASDSSAVLHLPHVIASLSDVCFLPSPHISKWTMRVNSLLHSKDAGARWSGLCLAYYTAELSRDTLLEHAQSWLGVALQRNEPLPTLKASIRLLTIIFSTTTGIPEFQRQVATPNVPKFTAVLIGLVDKYNDEELRVLILATLTRLVPLYPTLHRASHPALSTLSLRFLNGSAPDPTRAPLLEAASRLYAVLHFTGGKVGAANLWKKSVDETLTFGWSAFAALRTTFRNEGRQGLAVPGGEGLLTIPLNLDRLRCCAAVLCELLRSTVQRPVQVPLGPLTKFIMTLLSCTKDDPVVEHSDPTTQTMEISVIPDVWKIGCDIASCLAGCAGHHLTPHLTQLISYLTFHLEQKPALRQRLFLLRTVYALLSHCYLLDTSLLPTRLAKAVLPSLSIILATSPQVQTTEELTTSNKTRKGKKRTRGYEGDEIFRLSRDVICPSVDDGKALLAALDVMRLLLRNHNISPALRSISSRVLISMLFVLPQISPASLSPDLSLHQNILQKVHEINMEIGSGTTSIMSKSLGLVVRATALGENYDGSLRSLEMLLHPRMPPLLRSLPHVESLSLFRAEEPQEEIEARKELGLQNPFSEQHPPSIQDISMEEDTAVLSPPKTKDVDLTIPNVPLSLNPTPSLSHPELSAAIVQSSPTPSPMLSLGVPTSQHMKPPVAIKPLPPPSAPLHIASASVETEDEEEIPPINMDSDSDVD